MVQLDKKFWNDTVWNYGSFCVQAAVGLLLNFMIALRLGIESLGVFNQIYAIYVIAGQIAVFGLHDSAQKHISQFHEDADSQHAVSMASVAAVALAGFLGAAVLAFSSRAIGLLTQSKAVGLGVLFLSPGLFLFAINKVLMGILNGYRRMVAFSIGSATRALGILAGCIVIVMTNGMAFEFGIAFTAAELLLSIILIAFIRPIAIKFLSFADFRLWVSQHMVFGSRALVHSFLTETFMRIDIIMLGIFTGDKEVGIYSLAAFFAEGIYQVPVVIRTIVNPMLARLLAAKEKAPLSSLIRKTALVSFMATLSISLAVVIAYPHLALFFPRETIASSYVVLGILLAGILLYSTCVPFDYIFLQAGRPGFQSLFMVINTTSNVVLNFILIPPFGIYGACIATAIAFVFSGINLNVLARRILEFHADKLRAS